MSEAKLGEDCPRCRETEVLDQVLPQKPHGDGIDQKSTLPSEANEASFGVKLQELSMIQIFYAHD
jgi:hypothetical protein